ncbi:MAG: hypothetical protein IKP98_02260 [Bacilli bacterium]|nr:hypothetical protein [Bacilli bacterium]
MDAMETRLLDRINECVDNSILRDNLNSEVDKYQEIISKLKMGKKVPGYSKSNLPSYRMYLVKILQQSRDAEVELKNSRRIYNNILKECNKNVISFICKMLSQKIANIEDQILLLQTDIYVKENARKAAGKRNKVYSALVEAVINESKSAVTQLVMRRSYYNTYLLYLSEQIGLVMPKAFEKKLKE